MNRAFGMQAKLGDEFHECWFPVAPSLPFGLEHRFVEEAQLVGCKTLSQDIAFHRKAELSRG
ncbi:hypothetical protein D3C83_150330 [compost metagenome]